jgi:hypothetical protein
MKSRLVYTLFIVLAMHSVCRAQQANTLQFTWKLGTVQRETTPVFYSENRPLFFPMSNERTFAYPQEIKYTLPKGAIFCRMEDALYKHLNVLIKVRMGTDDKYSN